MTTTSHERIPVTEDVAIEVETISGSRSGPVVVVLGGVHGDELEGVAAVRMLSTRLAESLTSGQVRLVAVANPLAFEARARRTPVDGGDLARSFPGDPEGGVTERMAAALTREVIASGDLLIDLHSAGADFAMPFFAGLRAGQQPVDVLSEQAARAFGAPLLWLHDAIADGRSLTAALALGIPSMYAEAGGGRALRRQEVEGFVVGVERVLGRYGMTSAFRPAEQAPKILRGGTGNVDVALSAPVEGWCITQVAPGQHVEVGTPVAEILSEQGTVEAMIRTPQSGTVMMLRRRAEVSVGDPIAVIGPVAEPS